MKKIFLAALAVCLLLGGCSALLERSYSMVEPYADRYWDSGEEDTLRVDSYQDLVNSLVMLIEQRAEEAVIRCYGDVGSYTEALKARNEVRWETTKGSYLLQSIQFKFEDGSSYGTATFQMAYREDAEDLANVMTLTDSQSLVDLLRLAVREDHEKLTAQFTFETPREAVNAAVENYWQELCLEEMAAEAAALEGLEPDYQLSEGTPGGDAEIAEGIDETVEGTEEETEEETEASSEPEEDEPTEENAAGVSGEDPENADTYVSGNVEEPETIEYPPCPWTVRFYPNRETAELVEILLNKS